MNIYLVRHGQSDANAGLRTRNHADVPLTSLGMEQARAMAQRFPERPALVVVSPYLRARETAKPLLARFPEAVCEAWAIQEFSYLGAPSCQDTTPEMRRPMVDHYWKLCDPDYIDGPGAESFSGFVARLVTFRRRLQALHGIAAVAAIGHGQFFRAFMFGMEHGFAATEDWMAAYRAEELSTPLKNGDVVKITLD